MLRVPTRRCRIAYKSNLVGGSSAEHIIFHAVNFTQKSRLAHDRLLANLKNRNVLLLNERRTPPHKVACLKNSSKYKKKHKTTRALPQSPLDRE